MSTILVTGGSGYLGSWCIVRLLEAGYDVRATVRSLAKEQAVRDAIATQTSAGTLTVVAADLTSDDGWTEAMAGVDGVLHVASPLPAAEPKDRDEVIRPAADGTLRVLRAATAAGVPRVVLTSSAAACTPVPTGDVVWDEDTWTDPGQPGLSAYRASKVLAEQAAWDFVNATPGAPTLVTVLPGAIFGPPLPGTSRSSVEIVERMLSGALPAIPKVEVVVVDVRDLADLHLLALTTPGAHGRYLGAQQQMTMPQIASLLRTELGPRAAKVSRLTMPDAVARLAARFVPEMGTLVPMLGRHVRMARHRAVDELGWTPRSVRETLVATADAVLAD